MNKIKIKDLELAFNHLKDNTFDEAVLIEIYENYIQLKFETKDKKLSTLTIYNGVINATPEVSETRKLYKPNVLKA